MSSKRLGTLRRRLAGGPLRPTAVALLIVVGAALVLGGGRDAAAQAVGVETLWAARRSGDAAGTLAAARAILAAYPDPEAARVAHLLGGSAALALGDSGEWMTSLAEALRTPPRDPAWVEGAEAYTRALISQGYAYRAAQWAIDLAIVEPSRALALLEAIPSLPRDELRYLIWLADRGTAEERMSEESRCNLLAALAEKAAPYPEVATTAVRAGLSHCPAGSSAAERLLELVPGMTPAPVGFYDVAVICPVNGRYARFGEALAQGAYLALQELNQGSPYPLRLRVLDSQGDPLLAAQRAAGAVRSGVGALLGDLLTPATIAVAAAAEAGATPLVSPSATRSQIGEVGPYVFQTVVPREIQAEALARAVVDRLGLTRVAVLYPNNDTGRRVAARFRAAAEQRGAQIIAFTAYPEGQTNFAVELEPLAELLPEAVFIPGTPKELMAVVPQFAYYEVDARVLSLEELGLSEVLQATRDYLNEAVFADSFYRVPDERLQQFRDRYQGAYRSRPDAYATRGYVAMSVLARAVQSGARSRDDLADALAERVVELGAGDERGILLLGDLEGQVALFQASRADIFPLE